MPALLRIDQAGLPVGVPGVSRSDGLDTGALVTLTNLGGGATLDVRLLWVPPEDLSALATLTQINPTQFTFSPQAGTWGTYRIEMIVDLGLPTESRTRHTFGVRLPASGLLIPAANELADPSSNRQNDTDAFKLEASETNEPYAPFVARQPFGWWKELADLFVQAEAAAVRLDPTRSAHVEQDFLGPSLIDTGAILGSAETDLMFSKVETGAGAVVTWAASLQATAGHPGTVSLQTGTTNAGVAAIFALFGLNFSSRGRPRPGAGEIRLKYVFALSDLSTVGEEFIARVGSSTSATAPAGHWFEYDRLTSVNWILRSTLHADIVSTVPVTEDVWHTAEIVIDAAGANISYYMDGVLLGGFADPLLVTIPIPSAMFAIVKSAGITTRNIFADYCSYDEQFTSPR